MSAEHIEVLSPIPVGVPRGAEWAARAASWLVRRMGELCAALWRALEAHGAHRAARELDRTAEVWDVRDPAKARALRFAGAYMRRYSDPASSGSSVATRQSDEETPAQLAASEAAKVRALADRVSLTDRGFASDLYAAADRHEQSFEGASAAAR